MKTTAASFSSQKTKPHNSMTTLLFWCAVPPTIDNAAASKSRSTFAKYAFVAHHEFVRTTSRLRSQSLLRCNWHRDPGQMPALCSVCCPHSVTLFCRSGHKRSQHRGETTSQLSILHTSGKAYNLVGDLAYPRSAKMIEVRELHGC